MKLVTLPAHPTHDLSWDIPFDPDATCYLDFGWDNKFNPLDPGLLAANMLAVKEFAKRFPKAVRVALARSSGEFHSLFHMTPELEERFAESGTTLELFSAKLFSEYLHRLASILPDEIEPLIILDFDVLHNFERLVLLFCRRRFEHFQLHFSQHSLPVQGESSIVVSIPQDGKYVPERFKPLYQALSGLLYKCIPEEFLNENWDGVDVIIVDPVSLGETGMRMLYGFEATGGQIVSTEHLHGFENFILLEEFLKKKKDQAPREGL